MFEENCDHEFEENICTKCNLVIDKIFGKKYDADLVVSNNKYNIIDELKRIPSEVINKAKSNIIMKQKETGKKIRNDKKQTFIQVYQAVLELRCQIDPNIISKQLNLGKKETNDCIKEITKTSLIPSNHEEVNDDYPIVMVHPKTYIKELCFVNDIEKYKDILYKITEEILTIKDDLITIKPFYVACAIIKCFCNKKNINIKSFSVKNGISDNALKKATVEVEDFF